MGSHHFPFPAQIGRAPAFALLCLLALPARAQQQKPAAGAADKGALPDVLIQAEQDRTIPREKPPLKFDVKEEMPLESLLKTEDELRLRLPSEVAKSTPPVAALSNSPYVATPSGNRILLLWKGEPARVFAPAKELAKTYKETELKAAAAKARWELVVADAAGGIFRKFSGAGLPPATLAFDGKGDDGKWLRVGQVYTSVLTYHDAAGRAHTAMGRSFSLQGLAVQGADGFMIDLDPQAALETDGPAYKLSESGRELLRESGQIIQRYYAGLGIEIAARVSRAEPAAAQQAAELCAKELARLLVLPGTAVAARGAAGTPDLERRLEIHVLNR